MRKVYESSFVCRMEVLENELQKLSQFLESEFFGSPHSYGISLAFEEIGTNIVKYSDAGSEIYCIEIVLYVDGDHCILDIIDNTHPFNPLVDAPEPDTGKGVEERDIGGLGIMLVKNFAKDISYEYLNSKNHLKITF